MRIFIVFDCRNMRRTIFCVVWIINRNKSRVGSPRWGQNLRLDPLTCHSDQSCDWLACLMLSCDQRWSWNGSGSTQRTVCWDESLASRLIVASSSNVWAFLIKSREEEDIVLGTLGSLSMFSFFCCSCRPHMLTTLRSSTHVLLCCSYRSHRNFDVSPAEAVGVLKCLCSRQCSPTQTEGNF